MTSRLGHMTSRLGHMTLRLDTQRQVWLELRIQIIRPRKLNYLFRVMGVLKRRGDMSFYFNLLIKKWIKNISNSFISHIK